MPFSIDSLSIRTEAQKIKLNPISEDNGYRDSAKDNDNIYTTKDLIEQDPITVF